jgi:hypothetical protein
MSADSIALKLLTKLWHKLRWIGPRGARNVLLLFGTVWTFSGASQTLWPDLPMSNTLPAKYQKARLPLPAPYVAVRGAAMFVTGLCLLAFTVLPRPAGFETAARSSLTILTIVSLGVRLVFDGAPTTAPELFLKIATVSFSAAFLLILMRMVTLHEERRRRNRTL